MKKLILATMLVASPAIAAPSQVIAQIGQWKVERSVDAMSDAKSCTAYYGGQNYVQLTKNGFAIGYGGRGGLQGYRIRLDDQPASEIQIPSDSEKQIGAFVLEGNRFARVIAARRVRVQAITVLSTMVDDDIDMSATPAVLAKLNGPDCN